jgi:hypothetical protein
VILFKHGTTFRGSAVDDVAKSSIPIKSRLLAPFWVAKKVGPAGWNKEAIAISLSGVAFQRSYRKHVNNGSSSSSSLNKHIANTNCVVLYPFCVIFRHNDLPWNIRKFIHNKLNTVNFTSNLKTEDPWGTSQWSHTDLSRLSQGQVGGQVVITF